MATTMENGYLGKISIESGAGISRLPTMSGYTPVYAPFNEGGWASELQSPDGRYRFMSGGAAIAATAAMHNYNDTITILTLLRMKPQLADFGTVISKNTGTLGWILSEINSTQGYYTRIDTSGGTNQGPLFATADMIKTQDRNWHWLGVSLDKGTYRRWLDGAPLASGTYAHGAGFASTDRFKVKTDGATQTQIACVLVFDRLLSDAEVAALVSGETKPRAVSGLQGYYKFNEPSGIVGACIDYSGKGNHLDYSADVVTITEEWSPDGSLLRDPGLSNAAAWAVASGYSVGGGKISIATPSVNAGVRQSAPGIISGNTYRVSFDVSNYVSGNVRVQLCGPSGSYALTQPRSANGSYTEDITIANGSGAASNLAQIYASVANTTLDITNLSVRRLTGMDGASGMPYVTRQKLNINPVADNLFRSPPSLSSAAAQGSIITGAPGVASVPDSPSMRLAGDHTIAGWIKIPPGSAGTIWSKNTTEGRLDVNSGGRSMTLYRNGASVTLTLNVPIPISQWVFVAATYVDGMATFYLNGVLAGAKPFSPGVPAFTSATATLGAISSGRPTACRSIRVYSRALTAVEIEKLFQTDSAPRNDSALVGEWLCNEVWSTQVRDTSGYANHGTSASTTRLLDSPYAVPRRKRLGKQLNMTSSAQGIWFSSTALRDLLVGARCITLAGWLKHDVPLAGNPQRFGINTSATTAGVIISSNGILSVMASYVRAAIADAVATIMTTPATTPRGTWTLFALEVDFTAKTMAYFVNGVKVSVMTGVSLSADTFTDPGNPSIILQLGNGGGHYRADAMRIYNRQLSTDEHYGLFLEKAPRDGLVVEYLFDNDSTRALDSSGNGFHATYSAATQYVTQP